MGNVGLPEILVIAVISLLIFGPRRLPEIARNAGRALHEFKRVTGELTEELKAGLEEPQPPSSTPPSSTPPSSTPPGTGVLTHTEMLPVPEGLHSNEDGQETGPAPGALPGQEPPDKDL